MADFSATFQTFGASVAAAAIHQQDLFNEAVGPANWMADLDTRTLSSDQGVLGGISLLGSFAHEDGTWLWGWANPGFGTDAPAVAPTLAIRTFGEQHGIPEFATGEADFSSFPDPAQAATTVAIAASALLGGSGVWSTAVNDGEGIAFVHVADDQLPQATFDAITAPRLLMAAVSVFPTDHRRVVQGYLDHFAVPYAESPTAIRATAPDGNIVVTEFDELGRIANLAINPA